ncbi:MAG: hypothetical protein LUG13_02395 [Oscillospiraceae bacterium]|nr:hypothetical protein [Oscillospiraceae bacterium]
MNPILEIVLAFLSSFGLLCLGWMLFGRLLAPWKDAHCKPVYAVVPASGAGVGLEQTVRAVKRLQMTQNRPVCVVIADDGLDATGRAVADVLAREEAWVTVRPIVDVRGIVKEYNLT